MRLEPSTYLREPGVIIGDGGGEASAAGRMAGGMEPRKGYSPGRRGFPISRRQPVGDRPGKGADRPAMSEPLWTYAPVRPGPERSQVRPAAGDARS